MSVNNDKGMHCWSAPQKAFCMGDILQGMLLVCFPPPPCSSFAPRNALKLLAARHDHQQLVVWHSTMNRVPRFLWPRASKIASFHSFSDGHRVGEDDMPLEEAVKDAERQTYYKGYLESMVTAVSDF